MSTPTNTDAAEQVKLAAQVFIYGYPLVYSMNELAKFPRGTATLYTKVLPYNTFGYARELMGPQAHFVSPNNDTLYMFAICDLRGGPLVLHVPDTNNRYYGLQFIDAWSNNFAYVGRRATGTKEGNYLIATHDYQGAVPEGMQVIHVPTGVFLLGGRVAVNGAADLPAAHALQDQFTVTPLSVYQGGAAPADLPGLPKPDPRVPDELKWWEKFRVALAAFPPPAADAPFLALCEKFGLTAAESPYIDPSPELERLLTVGQKAAEDKIEELIKTAIKRVNGWQNSIHVFDYNVDYFEIGTINAPEWKIADRKMAYVIRAVAARAGLWGNHGYEANYQLIYTDADDQPLDSAKRYELHLPVPPPVGAFWSLTMYDAHEFYLVDNVIHRYSIGDRTPGLKYAADGSVTIYMQKDNPGPEKESNWLPTPQTGNFRPIMRMYQPQEPLLDGSYHLPGIKCLG
jgi:hypothetical protein